MEFEPAIDLSFIIPNVKENRWSDLLATFISNDPEPISRLLGVRCTNVRREVVIPSLKKRKSDRLDLLLMDGESPRAAIEVKLLSIFGPKQLARYEAAVPGLDAYFVLELQEFPIHTNMSSLWKSITWESVLDAYCESEDVWVAETAKAWRLQLSSLVPKIEGDTLWNDVSDERPMMTVDLRARSAWLSLQMDSWSSLSRDITQGSGGGIWVNRMWKQTTRPQYAVVAELQDGLSVNAWKPDPKTPYRDRLKGPAVLVGLRLENVESSADFDWELLHRLFNEFVLDQDGNPGDDRKWHTTRPNRRDPVDLANLKKIADAGAPPWLGKGWGIAKTHGSCTYGAKFQLPPDSTMEMIDGELQKLEDLILRMAKYCDDEWRETGC